MGLPLKYVGLLHTVLTDHITFAHGSRNQKYYEFQYYFHLPSSMARNISLFNYAITTKAREQRPSHVTWLLVTREQGTCIAHNSRDRPARALMLS